MKVFHLPKPTEHDLRQEEADFNQAVNLYRESLFLLKHLKAWPMFTERELRIVAEQQYREAYHKIPTMCLLELDEILKQNHITV